MSQAMIVTTLAAGTAARRRLLSALARGDTVLGVFFFSDGVEAASAQEERHAWQALARRHRVALILCGASAQRRGLARTGEPPAGFELGQVDRFARLAEQADHVDVAGRT